MWAFLSGLSHSSRSGLCKFRESAAEPWAWYCPHSLLAAFSAFMLLLTLGDQMPLKSDL